MRGSNRDLGWLAVALITLGAAALRLVDLGAVRLDPFYDAAVRSMTLSWHNFFFGAFEPGGSVSIDKPPLDLWLQVASVKAFGWSSFALKLPEALAGTLSVPLLFAAVRRPFGTPAGLGAAAALAVMPIEVITARSDTMDAVMMALLTLCLLLVVRACESGRTRWLLAAAAALGLAFNVKLLESLIALPGLAAIVLVGFPVHGLRARGGRLLATGAVLVAVALSWLGATLLFSAHDRPFAIGSTNGSAWNAAFVFNGLDRVTGKAVEGAQTSFQPGRDYPQATQAERDSIPITPPSATRLLARIGPLSGARLGLELLAALLLGLPAVALAWRRHPPSELALRSTPLARSVGVGLVVWLAVGTALFSDMARLHPRYVEAFTPAVAALLGIGAAWAASLPVRPRAPVLGGALAIVLGYAVRLEYGTPAVWWVALAAALTAFALALAAIHRPASIPAAAVLATLLIALLAIPLRASVEAVRLRSSDAGSVGALPADELGPLSAYLRAHQGDARYELVADSATKIGSLIVQDARPVVVLTSYEARTLTTVTELERLIARGEVRYALLSSLCGPHTPRSEASCSAPALWVRAHGLDVSRAAGLPPGKLLLELPRAIA